MSRRRLVLGFGGNLGDRESTLTAAMGAIAADRAFVLLGAAPFYESPPFGGPPQSDYLNSALLLDTALLPRQVLARALAVEHSLGRLRPDAVRWGPRTIDIDLLWIDGVAVDEPGLVVPHPRLHERAFALRPLLDLVPDAVDPRSGERLSTFEAARAAIARHADAPQLQAL
jgi:2-amino-4-hydroxy-6-hydroxymethyldihydropteridine diphosphokinase